MGWESPNFSVFIDILHFISAEAAIHVKFSDEDLQVAVGQSSSVKLTSR